MKDREQLQWVCLLFMIVLTVAGAAFALWVHWMEAQQADPWTVQEAEVLEHTASKPEMMEQENPVVSLPADTAICEKEAFTGPDPLCEDSYLMPEHPLSMDLQVLLYGACLEMGVDFDLALAVIEQETTFRNVTGDDGDSCGYMQVQEKWHKERMAELGVTDLMDPESNFRVGCHFLKECIDKYGLERGLGYYNGGKAAVTNYSLKVMERIR